MQIAIIIVFFVFLTLSNNRRRSILSVRADPGSCRKQVECFVCDSREIQECEDPRTFAQIPIPTRLCDDYCLKMWTRENDSILGDDKTKALRYVKRDCHKIFHFDIKKAETCYQHKRHYSDVLCLCSSDRCNSSMNVRLKRIDHWFSLMFFHLLLY